MAGIGLGAEGEDGGDDGEPFHGGEAGEGEVRLRASTGPEDGGDFLPVIAPCQDGEPS
jgi:hypothetical protein